MVREDTNHGEGWDPLTLFQDLNPFMNSSQGNRTTLVTHWIHTNLLDFHSINTILEPFC